MVRFSFCFLLVLFFLSSRAQIVNIEPQRMQSDTTGWLGNMGASFSFVKNTQEVLNINTNAHLQYKSKKSLYLLLANYNLLKGNQQKLTDNMFYHLRYNRKLTSRLRWEVFTQWQQDVVSNIGLRILAGTGPRFKLHNSKQLRLYAATAAMYEYEKEKSEPPVFHNDLRSSSYVSLTWQPNPLITLISTTFYQPLFRQINDFRVLNQVSFVYKTGKRLSFTTSWNYLYDSAPAVNTPNINYALSNGISYTFK